MRGWLDRAERFLGSPMLSLVCFSVLSMKVVDTLGWGFDEYLLLFVIYVHFSTMIEQMNKRLSGSSTGGEG